MTARPKMSKRHRNVSILIPRDKSWKSLWFGFLFSQGKAEPFWVYKALRLYLSGPILACGGVFYGGHFLSVLWSRVVEIFLRLYYAPSFVNVCVCVRMTIAW